MTKKKLFFTIVALGQVIVFVYLYVSGAHGLRAVRALRSECSLIRASCATLQNEVQELREYVHDWNVYPAYREVAARQQLHLVAPHEEWFRY